MVYLETGDGILGRIEFEVSKRHGGRRFVCWRCIGYMSKRVFQKTFETPSLRSSLDSTAFRPL